MNILTNYIFPMRGEKRRMKRSLFSLSIYRNNNALVHDGHNKVNGREMIWGHCVEGSLFGSSLKALTLFLIKHRWQEFTFLQWAESSLVSKGLLQARAQTLFHNSNLHAKSKDGHHPVLFPICFSITDTVPREMCSVEKLRSFQQDWRDESKSHNPAKIYLD